MLGFFKKHITTVDRSNLDALKQINLMLEENEAKVRKAESKYKLLFENANDTILITDMEFNILEINDFAEFTYGYGSKEFIGKNYEDLLFSIDLAHTELESLKMINKNPMINNRLFIPLKWHKKKDGSKFPVEVKVSILHNGEKFCVITIHNITERMLADNQIRLSEEKFRKSFEYSPVSKIVLSMSSRRILDCNIKFCEFLEWDKEEIIGRKLEELFLVGENSYIEIDEQLWDKGYLNNYKCKAFTKTCNEKIILLSMQLLEYNGEKCIFGTAIDITEQEKVHNEMLFTNMKLSTMLNIADDLYNAKSFIHIGKAILDNLIKFRPTEEPLFGMKLCVYDKDVDEYQTVYQTAIRDKGLNIGIPTGNKYKLSEIKYYSAKAIQESRTLIIKNSHSEESLIIDNRQAQVKEHSMIFIPLFYDGNLVGLFSFAMAPVNSLTQDLIDMLDSIAKYVSIAIGQRFLINKK